MLNLHAFHLLQTTSEQTIDLDVGVPARGWTGEAYRGHILWDEIFAYHYLNLRLPQVTRSLLLYRWRRLPQARRAAHRAGHGGALYPWQSGSDGREESQRLHLNPRSGRWIPDHSWLQRHINIAVAYNVWQYCDVTGDATFLAFYGTEILVEIARFWASLATFDRTRNRYEIDGVMGPDEFHDGYPWRDEPGLDNNAYTNVMVVWTLLRAKEALDAIPALRREELVGRLGLGQDELVRWDDITRRMLVCFHDDGVISQFEGYEQLEEFDWEGCRRKYGDIQRLDRILEAEDDTPNRYKVSKQADVLMLFYLLPVEELRAIFERLGYTLDPGSVQRTIAYYLERTSHGSTLSGVVHSWVLARAHRHRSLRFFRQALQSDVADIQGGTTPEGIHLGAMAGTLDLVQRGYTGLEPRGDVLWLNPLLPDEIPRLEFTLRFRAAWGVRLAVTHERIRVTAPPDSPVKVGYDGEVWDVPQGGTVDIGVA